MNQKSTEVDANAESPDVEKAVLLYNKAVYCFYVCIILLMLRERLYSLLDSLQTI